MKLILIACFCPSLALAGSVSLAGNSAGEANGNGWALVIPDLLASAPGVFVPVRVAPKSPFNIGTITWNNSAVPATGTVAVPVTNAMCAFNFQPYFQDVVTQLAVIGTGGANVVLSGITGPGLSSKDGVLQSIDFAASVSWTPTLNGFPASQPYLGTLVFTNGSFVWDLADNTANWLIGASGVHFEFDLTGTVSGLVPPVPGEPRVSIARGTGDAVTVSVPFTAPTNAPHVLESSTSLSGMWEVVGTSFDSGTVPGPLSFPTSGVPKRFFRVRSLP